MLHIEQRAAAELTVSCAIVGFHVALELFFLSLGAGLASLAVVLWNSKLKSEIMELRTEIGLSGGDEYDSAETSATVRGPIVKL